MNFIRKPNGELGVVTNEGRLRKNWKVPFRKKARRLLKDKCEVCGSKENLTIHHDPPLSKTIETEKFITMCRPCHDLEEIKDTV